MYISPSLPSLRFNIYSYCYYLYKEKREFVNCLLPTQPNPIRPYKHNHTKSNPAQSYPTIQTQPDKIQPSPILSNHTNTTRQNSTQPNPIQPDKIQPSPTISNHTNTTRQNLTQPNYIQPYKHIQTKFNLAQSYPTIQTQPDKI